MREFLKFLPPPVTKHLEYFSKVFSVFVINDFLLYFGVNTMWYLHNHFVCARLLALCAIATPSFLAISELNNRYARRKDFNLQSKKYSPPA